MNNLYVLCLYIGWIGVNKEAPEVLFKKEI